MHYSLQHNPCIIIHVYANALMMFPEPSTAYRQNWPISMQHKMGIGKIQGERG